jgi:hypothetical protein
MLHTLPISSSLTSLCELSFVIYKYA